ncbi:MAG: SUMF1/EgtB/PvdO family nonheme iron enzyme [Planctomycetota bacterium]|nr:SUMF1/EgtB/PvdO family nonheme iron enzyme [Planctomycetota bacterium]
MPAQSPDSVMLLFWRYEITRAEYWEEEGAGDHPVTMITTAEAKAWANTRGFRLPTLEEWRLAAQDGKGAAFPSRGALDGKANVMELGLHETLPVGVFERGSTRYGLFDMMGNVWEWVEQKPQGHQFPPPLALACGGSFAQSGDDLSSQSVRLMSLGEAADDLGFRVCVDAETWIEKEILPLWANEKNRASISASFALWDPSLRIELERRMRGHVSDKEFLQEIAGRTQ